MLTELFIGVATNPVARAWQAERMVSALGRVIEFESGLRYRVFFPDQEHAAATLFLRELAASDCSPTTLRSYAYDLLRWFRFLHARSVRWERAVRVDVRELVESMRASPTATAERRGVDAVLTPNVVTGRPARRVAFAPRTINHQLTVTSSFYDFALETDLGPLVNPVPRQGVGRGRAHEHHNPMQPFSKVRRAAYRQREPKPVWRGIPDSAISEIFSTLTSNRDRALLAFWLSSGARATELLEMHHGDYDFGEQTITVVSKGTRDRERVPASSDAFVWLALYMGEGQPSAPGDRIWWTLQGKPPRPFSYHAARAMFARAQRKMGSNWTLHDLRHTAAERLLEDPSFTLVDVQTILRHASISTTTIYTQPRMEDVVAKVLAHHSRPKPESPSISPNYDDAAVRELLGLAE